MVHSLTQNQNRNTHLMPPFLSIPGENTIKLGYLSHNLLPMSSKQIGEVQDQLYKEMYEKFAQLIAELTNLVDESQRKIVEYKSNLETSVIPQSVGIRLDSTV